MTSKFKPFDDRDNSAFSLTQDKSGNASFDTNKVSPSEVTFSASSGELGPFENACLAIPDEQGELDRLVVLDKDTVEVFSVDDDGNLRDDEGNIVVRKEDRDDCD